MLERLEESQRETQFGLEQPSSPKDYAPEVVSFWDTKEWMELKNEFQWSEFPL